MAKYVITNFGNSRRLPYKGQFYFIAKNGTIETDDKELADTLGSYPYIDAKAVEQLKKKVTVTTGKNKTIKRRKN